MRKRSAAGSSPNASPASTAIPCALEQVVGELGAAAERQPRELGIEVEGAARRAALRAGGHHHVVGGGR